MLPRFSEDRGGYADLLCPECNYEYLHHGAVEVFERSEDASGLHVLVDAGKVMADRDMTGNPSTRRHGIRIMLTCEGCQAESELLIAQHKGNTEVQVNVVRSGTRGDK